MTPRYLTRGRSTQDFDGSFFKKEQLGPKQSVTPEGFLLCEEVPLARPGEMLYGPGEVPIDDVDGQPIVVHRTADDLFRPETIASFNGKPVTNDHPDEDVTPRNWKRYCVGTLMNVRVGTGDNEGLMVGDLLITDPTAIEDVRSGKREVSLGYDADYEQTAPGVGRQTNIIGNHVALVERGRCGPRCAIGDRQTVSDKESNMPSVTVKGPALRRRSSAADALARFRDAAEAALKDLEDGEGATTDEDLGDSGASHIHIHMEGSTAPANAAVIDEHMEGGYGGQSGGPELADEGMQGQYTEDDPVEQRFQTIEAALADIGKALHTLTQQLGAQVAHEQSEGDLPPDAQADLSQDNQIENGDLPDGPEPDLSDRSMDEAMNAELGEGMEARDEALENNSMVKPDDVKAKMGKTGDKAAKFRDSSALESAYKETLALAEILVPGFRMSTFDRAAPIGKTYDSICSARRKCLDAAYATADGKTIIDSVNTAKTYDTSVMGCAAVRSLFLAAAGAKKLVNNAAMTKDSGIRQNAQGFVKTGKVQSIEDLNALNRQHYAAQRKPV